jgi:helicase
MVKPDPQFELFFHDFQVRTGTVDACRMCLLDERFTPLDDDNGRHLRQGGADLS